MLSHIFAAFHSVEFSCFLSDNFYLFTEEEIIIKKEMVCNETGSFELPKHDFFYFFKLKAKYENKNPMVLLKLCGKTLCNA